MGNELADQEALNGTRQSQETVGWMFEVAKARCRGVLKRTEFTHDRSRATYQGNKIVEEDLRGLTRERQVQFRRFRMGHTLESRGYQKRIGLSEEGKCRACEAEEESVLHIVEVCPAMHEERERRNIWRMADLVNNVKGALEYKDTFMRKGAQQ